MTKKQQIFNWLMEGKELTAKWAMEKGVLNLASTIWSLKKKDKDGFPGMMVSKKEVNGVTVYYLDDVDREYNTDVTAPEWDTLERTVSYVTQIGPGEIEVLTKYRDGLDSYWRNMVTTNHNKALRDVLYDQSVKTTRTINAYKRAVESARIEMSISVSEGEYKGLLEN